jgi:hypothetical protein
MRWQAWGCQGIACLVNTRYSGKTKMRLFST